jgi:hypothetical protein
MLRARGLVDLDEWNKAAAADARLPYYIMESYFLY